MTTNKISQPTGGRRPRRLFRDFLPSAAADAELTWFFNEAEIAIEQPSNFQGLIAGASVTSLPEVERRAEAMHAARKIEERLKRLLPTDALLLAGLYTELPWSRAVTRALPGGLAGAARVWVPVLAAYVRTLTRGQTHAKDIAEFVEETVRAGPQRSSTPGASLWRSHAQSPSGRTSVCAATDRASSPRRTGEAPRWLGAPKVEPRGAALLLGRRPGARRQCSGVPSAAAVAPQRNHLPARGARLLRLPRRNPPKNPSSLR